MAINRKNVAINRKNVAIEKVINSRNRCVAMLSRELKKLLINIKSIKNIYREPRQQENPKKSVDNFDLFKKVGLIYPPI